MVIHDNSTYLLMITIWYPSGIIYLLSINIWYLPLIDTIKMR